MGFSILFMSVSTGAIHYYFRNKHFTRLTIIIYIALGLAALVTELIIHFIKLPSLSVNILHAPETIIQSPLVLLILFASLFLYTNKGHT